MFSPDSRLSQGQCGCVCGSSSVHTSVSAPRPASHKAAAIQDPAPTETQPTASTVTRHMVAGSGQRTHRWAVHTGPTHWARQQLAVSPSTRWRAAGIVHTSGQSTPAPQTGPGNSQQCHPAQGGGQRAPYTPVGSPHRPHTLGQATASTVTQHKVTGSGQHTHRWAVHTGPTHWARQQLAVSPSTKWLAAGNVHTSGPGNS